MKIEWIETEDGMLIRTAYVQAVAAVRGRSKITINCFVDAGQCKIKEYWIDREYTDNDSLVLSGEEAARLDFDIVKDAIMSEQWESDYFDVKKHLMREVE